MFVKGIFSLRKSINLLTFWTCSCSAALQNYYRNYLLLASSCVQVYRILWRPGLSDRSLKGIFVSTTLSRSQLDNASYMTNAFTDGLFTICVQSSTIGTSTQFLQLVAGLSRAVFCFYNKPTVFLVWVEVFGSDFFASRTGILSGFFGLIQIAYWKF